MTIFLFGVLNAGKTTTGEMLSRKLEYDFYDLDEGVKKFYMDGDSTERVVERIVAEYGLK